MARQIAQRATTQATRASAHAAAQRVPSLAAAPKRTAKKVAPRNDCGIALPVSVKNDICQIAAASNLETVVLFGQLAAKLEAEVTPPGNIMADDLDETPECFKEHMCEGRV